MKRAGLLVLLVGMFVTTQLFAVADQLNIATEVSEIGLMKITSSVVSANTVTAFNNTPEFFSFAVNGSGQFDNIAYVSTLSNKQSGYYITMSAEAMRNGTGTSATYINYSVLCNSVGYTTTGASVPPAVQLISVSSLLVITASSLPISIVVDPTSFSAAVSGSYIGTVTFTFSAQ